MNNLTKPINFNYQLINSFFTQSNHENKNNNLHLPTPKNDYIVKTNAEYLKNNPDLMKNFIHVSQELVKMGFQPNIINNLFIVTHYQSLSTAIDFLSKIDNKWNHNYVPGDENICFICKDVENNHKNITLIIDKNNKFNTSLSKTIKYKENPSMLNDEMKNNDFSIKINISSCQICFLEIFKDKKFSLKCNHQFCMECIIYYLEDGINNGRVSNITCPSKDCTETFTEDMLRLLISDKIYHKYKKFLNREIINRDPNLLLCPIFDCEGYVKISEEEKENIIRENLEITPKDNNPIKYVCNNLHNFCSKCKKIWHNKSSCEDDKEVLEFSTNTGNILKKCPQCNVWTEKDEGCNHMHCRLCLFDWCWICENHCSSVHFTDPNSTCFGKQFNENGDPNIENYLLINNPTGLFDNIFFFFSLSFLIISNCITTINTVRARNIDLNCNQNNENTNRNLMENGMGNNYQNAIIRPNKFTLLIILCFVIGIIASILALSNGILLIYLITNISKLDNIRNRLPKLICVFTFLLIYIIFFVFGIALSVFWLIICVFYSLKKLYQA